ncbi:MAG: hypothetical protein L6R40_003790 [Gallowayella cf. fulva]|nr:MAG: hypothetical protein L6R40_003790 [Xanthomendoza cf. fulva]
MLPSPDKKATIARSMSRYKGARPKPPHTTSRHLFPALTPNEPSAGSLADSKDRTATAFDHSHCTADAHDNDDDTLVSPNQHAGKWTSAQHYPRSPEAPEKSRPEHNLQACARGEENDYAPQGQETTQPYKPDPQRRHPDNSRSHQHRPPHARRSSEDARRHAFPPAQDSRRIALPMRPAMVQKKSFSQRIAGLVSQPQSAAEAKEQLKSMISNPIPIEPKDPLPHPQFDAPKSAVNAGARTVRVKYKGSQVPVTIVPSTTPADVIRSVSDKVASPIDQSSSVMLESFKQLGLERPLRRYEHIRDVLNSWDSDAQNTLTIESSSTGGNDDDLEVKCVPKNQPGDASFYLYHSQRPGHWDKRVVTVRSDGQMLVAKSEGEEFSNICHLSDFDIYIPTVRQMAKKIRPPKRICFAVKSQQKSNMFVSTVNFVHFFSSNDKRMAKSLYTAVQGWRSWYLVNRMGQGIGQSSQPTRRSQTRSATAVDAGRKTADLGQSSHPPITASRTHSVPSKPSFEANTRAAAQRSQQNDVHPAYWKDVSKDRSERQAAPTHLEKPSTVASTEDPFTGGGLLGRTYTQRKQAQQGHDTRNSGTPVQIPAASPSPVKADLHTDGLKRISSQRQKPKPLVDLTPVYQEPPQHSRKGRGITPGQIPAGGLIDIATSPEVAIPIPPTNEWRRPGTSSGAEICPARGEQYR